MHLCVASSLQTLTLYLTQSINTTSCSTRFARCRVHADGLARTSNLGASAFDVDYKERPLFRLARCVEGDVREGDIVYYPADWWHQTLTKEVSVVSRGASCSRDLQYRF